MHLMKILQLVSLFFVTSAGQCHAGVIFSQDPVPISTGSYWVSDDAAGFYPTISWRTYDSFILGQDSYITGVKWRGAYWAEINRQNNPVFPDTVSWDVGIFADASGSAASTIVDENFAVASVDSTFIGINTFRGDATRMYEFSIDFAAPVFVQAGIQYWFSPRSRSTNREHLFLFSQGLGGDGTSLQTNLALGRTFVRHGDRAFQLRGSTVPEPTSLLAWSLLGMFASCFRSRRRVT